MAFCNFSKDFSMNSATYVDNKFIFSYLPIATGDAVKVYLYGLLVCAGGDDSDEKTFAENLKLSVDTVKDCFRFWEELGLVNVVSDSPLIVTYLPVNSSKPRKINPEKYTEFNKSLQFLIPDRMITTNEYSAYFSVMEDNSIKPEAMLMIVKYCVDLQGPAVGFRYVLKVANDFAARKLTTVEKIDKELSDYTMRSGDLGEIFGIVCPKKKPEVEDSVMYKKWTKELGFDKDAILCAAKCSKSKSMPRLDKEIVALYAAKAFSSAEIEKYYEGKNRMTALARNIVQKLSLYIEVIDPVLDNFVAPWLSLGYGEESLELIASYCFKKNRRDLAAMNDVVKTLYSKGLVSLDSIVNYIKETTGIDDFIKRILSAAGIYRKPTEWDRTNLKTWREWNFSDEMILEAAKISAGKSNPVPYINATLSSWKSQNIFSPDKISATRIQPKPLNDFAIVQRSYTKEELDSLINTIDDIDF